MLEQLPKAELHVHLDGTITAEMVKAMAALNQVTIANTIFDMAGTGFQWADFTDFQKVFEESFKVIIARADYQFITYNYLQALAKQNTHYAELIVSPYHATLNRISYHDMLMGVVAGIEDAKRDFNIDARILMVFLRHYGPAEATLVLEQILAEPHPYVVGVNLVGDIRQYEVKAFSTIFERARKAGFGVSCHAGELSGGPEEIWQAIDYLGATRISHGVRCVEDKALMDELIKRDIVLEICPTSNIVLGMYPDYASHPLREIHDAGIKYTLNTDDPAFFNTTLTQEYALAQRHYGLTTADLATITQTAMDAKFG